MNSLERRKIMKMRKKLPYSLGLIALLSSVLYSFTPASALTSGISIDFAAAEALTYNHQSGGGKWGNGDVNVDIERSLEGSKFACNDKVSFLTKVEVNNTMDFQANGAMTLELNYDFTLDTTGQSGLALDEPVIAEITTGDSANINDGGSSVSVLSTNQTGLIYSSGSQLLAKLQLTDVEAGETIVVRTTVNLKCKAGSSPTGNLQAKFDSATLSAILDGTPVVPAEAISGGAKTVDLKSVDQVSKPELALSKTVTTQGGNCPGLESITIAPDQTVRYCYQIINPSNSNGKAGAPVYNIFKITDDSGQYPDFEVTEISGLTDIDSDGQADDLAVGATATAYYEVAFDGDIDSTLINTAVVRGSDQSVGGSELVASDIATIYIDAPEGVPAISIEKTPDAQTVAEGSTANFTITLTNSGNVTLSNVTVTDALSPSCNYGPVSMVAAAVVTYTCSSGSVTGNFLNLAEVSGEWNGNTVTDSDSADVTVDYLPKIVVSKSANATSVPESGAEVTFTVEVKNEAIELFTLNSLIDDKFGDLNGKGSCVTPQSIGAGATYSCSFTVTLKSENLSPHTNTVTATGVDPQQNSTSDFDNASVGFTDVLPLVSITKVANPTAARWTGDYIDYKLTITNTGLESFVITSLADNKYSLSSECSALIGQSLAPAAFVSCNLLDVFVSGTAGGSTTNTATVVVADNEANKATASSSATVNFWWYGRTPGYWKNHSEAWTSGYGTTALIKNVFALPSTLLSSGILDLDSNKSDDNLIAGLAYKGGSTLKGGAQILLRAAIAALLNEAYYGADFPIATSPADLIAQVNVVLGTADRSQYITFASYLDSWNNAVHDSLP